MKSRAAFTFIELLMVVSVLGLLAFPMLGNYLTSRGNTDVYTSAQWTIDALQRAQLFAQSEKNSKSWGVRSVEIPPGFEIVSWDTLAASEIPTHVSVIEGKTFPQGIVMVNPFFVRFQQGTGETQETQIILSNKNQAVQTIEVSTTGIIESVTQP